MLTVGAGASRLHARATTPVPKELKWLPHWELSQPQTSAGLPSPHHPNLYPSPPFPPALLDGDLVPSKRPPRTAAWVRDSEGDILHLPLTVWCLLGLPVRFVSLSLLGLARLPRPPSESFCKVCLCSYEVHTTVGQE